jgi:4-amino-4-deoxy-L-arabinose transferase-like glycosyltransferase
MKNRILQFMRQNWILIILVILSAFLRFYRLGEIPNPINQDEAGAGYEAFSLLQTGKDKWGDFLPVYFSSWGSGQNVLYSYIVVPFIYLLGLSTMVVRLPQAILGVLTIPLLYFSVKKIYSRSAAILASIILTFSPWHIMMSRWALESNLLPFFVVLSTFFLSLVIDKNDKTKLLNSKYLILGIFCLGIACYAYATFWFILPFYLIFILVYYRVNLMTNLKYWLISLSVLIVTVFPLILFVLKNNILRQPLFFEDYLPFTVPGLVGDRITLSFQDSFNLFKQNINLLVAGGADGLPWNTFLQYPPIVYGFLLLVIVALVWEKTRDWNLFTLQIFAFIPVLFLFSMNLNRANFIWIPGLVVVSNLLVMSKRQLQENLPTLLLKYKFDKILVSIACLIFFIYSGQFVTDYFTNYNAFAGKNFYAGFVDSLETFVDLNEANSLNDIEPIFMTGKVPLNYVATAYAVKYPPEDFQKHAVYEKTNGIYDVKNFGVYYFDLNKFINEKGESYWLLMSDDEISQHYFDYICPVVQADYKNNNWHLISCTN